ncbi:MAG: 3-dehydroquinate synthase [Lachnospiraceae bacterium]|nr:3-dehydroquinate synthase [Lachnospiraceae bacterium]
MSQKITVSYENQPCYDIVIAPDFSLLKDELLKLSITGKKLAIITDSHVMPLYAKEVASILESAGNKVFTYAFAAGEANKNLNTVEQVYEFLIANQFDRTDCLVALGGGVVGDLCGYAAATYLRGVSFIQIPTTLLSQVDSSIGGKTGVDFKSYKNMVGAFHMPKLVYTALHTLKSLDERQFNSGLGEIIKHGIIKDAAYYAWLQSHVKEIKSLDVDTLEYMIRISDEIKRQVVEKDPKEKGERALLNFGHTLGHAMEKQIYEHYYHGECVVLGMIAAMQISLKRGLVTEEEFQDFIKLCQDFQFPLTVSGVDAQAVIAATKNDKKALSGKIKFILANSIGQAFIDLTVSEEEMKESLTSVLR